MKTYLLDIKDQLKNWSESLDAQAILCKKSWLVYNNDGVKEVFIFQNDGTLLISTNGDVAYAQWKYIPVSHSIIITNSAKQSFMMNPATYDGKVLALQKDGTTEFAFLIDQKEVEALCLQNLQTLQLYINHRDEYDRQMAEKKKAEAERKKAEKIKEIQAKEELQKEWEEFIETKFNEQLQYEGSIWLQKTGKIVSIILTVSFLATLLFIFDLSSSLVDWSYLDTLFFISLIVVDIMGTILRMVISTELDDKKEKIRKQYPLEQFKIDHGMQ